MSDYEGKHVVVTGGTGALGTGIVNRLLAAGALCHVTYRSERSVQEFPYRHRVTLYAVDTLDGRALTGLYAQVPRVDASIHVVGAFQAIEIAKTSVEDIRRMFDINAVSALLCCREAIRKARSQPGGAQGLRLVNIAAQTLVRPAGGMTAYAASKAAVAGMTQALAEEVRAEGILVNAIMPSVIDSPANRQAMPDADHSTWPTPEQIADLVVFLAGPRNHVTTGAVTPAFGRA